MPLQMQEFQERRAAIETAVENLKELQEAVELRAAQIKELHVGGCHDKHTAGAQRTPEVWVGPKHLRSATEVQAAPTWGCITACCLSKGRALLVLWHEHSRSGGCM